MNLLSLRAATTTVSLRAPQFWPPCHRRSHEAHFCTFFRLFQTLSSNKQKTAWLHFKVWTLVPFTDWLCLNMNHFHRLTGKRKCNKNSYLTPSFWTWTLQNETFYSESSFFVLSFCWCLPLETLCTLILPLFCSCLLQNKIRHSSHLCLLFSSTLLH